MVACGVSHDVFIDDGHDVLWTCDQSVIVANLSLEVHHFVLVMGFTRSLPSSHQDALAKECGLSAVKAIIFVLVLGCPLPFVCSASSPSYITLARQH